LIADLSTKPGPAFNLTSFTPFAVFGLPFPTANSPPAIRKIRLFGGLSFIRNSPTWSVRGGNPARVPSTDTFDGMLTTSNLGGATRRQESHSPQPSQQNTPAPSAPTPAFRRRIV
jgi:hypothetical protein